MSAKKMAIYVVIIILMLAGTGWVLYKNRQAAAPVLSSPGLVRPAATAETEKTRYSGGLDLLIFNSEKYRALRENVVVPEGLPDTGKTDPFKPN